MDGKQLSEHDGSLLAYWKLGELRPAKLLDDRLWRVTGYGRRLRVTVAPEGARQTDRDMKETVGLPVLVAEARGSEGELAAAVEWLEGANVSMGDLFAADGRGIEGSLFLGVIFKVVLGRNLFPGYREIADAEKARREERLRWRVEEAAKWAAFVVEAEEVGSKIKDLGVPDCGAVNPLTPYGSGSEDVVVSLGVVKWLVQGYRTADTRCALCKGVRDLETISEGGVQSRVCALCREILGSE